MNLAAAPELLVVLGGGPGATTRDRARAAADLALTRPRDAVIASGGYGLGTPEAGPSEAAAMREALVAAGVATDRVFVEDESRDTIGNALFVALRYLGELRPRPLVVVTSPSHLPRALAVFARVLPAWPLEGHASARRTGEDDAHERRLLAETDAFLDGIAPGDHGAIARRLLERWPEYAASARLTSFA